MRGKYKFGVVPYDVQNSLRLFIELDSKNITPGNCMAFLRLCKTNRELSNLCRTNGEVKDMRDRCQNYLNQTVIENRQEIQRLENSYQRLIDQAFTIEEFMPELSQQEIRRGLRNIQIQIQHTNNRKIYLRNVNLEILRGR
tara:strand:- start:211 stop:633 length:423 start_codon:yes stop_codon:yes gene_type:complete